ncbi:hypothetical protein ACU8V3_00800 [Cobetia marina]
MTPITRVIDAFVAQLAAISTANGHATDIAHIETEAIQINLRSETPLPLLHVRRLASNVDARAGRGRARNRSAFRSKHISTSRPMGVPVRMRCSMIFTTPSIRRARCCSMGWRSPSRLVKPNWMMRSWAAAFFPSICP